jgi:DNA uptake protein ComE-like DNA-binding protein
VEDAAAKLVLNRAPREMLRPMLGSDSLTDALLDWRDRNGPLADLAELRRVAGFDSARVAALGALVTVRGADVIDVNAAPARVLEVMPGLGPEAVSLILRRREAGRPIASGDELLSLLSDAGRQTLTSQYHQFTLHAGYRPPRLVVLVEGGVTRHLPVSSVRLTVVPVPQRLAVIRRETQ